MTDAFVENIVLNAQNNTDAAFNALKRNALGAKGGVDDLNGANARGARSHVDLSNAVDKAGYSLGEQRKIFKTLAAEASLLGGPLGNIIGKTGLLTVGSQRLSLGVTVAAVSIGALTAGLYASIKAHAEFESHQIKTSNALEQTATASGQTAGALDDMARRLAASGTNALDDVRGAQSELLKYKQVAGATFEFVLSKARDVAAGGFADLKTATKAIAEGFKDPTTAAEKFAEVGLKLSVNEQRLATDLYNSGRAVEARRVLQDALSKQSVGADAAASDTLDAAYGRLKNSTLNLAENFGKTTAEGVGLKGLLGDLASWADRTVERFNKLKAALPETKPGDPIPDIIGTAFRTPLRPSTANALSGRQIAAMDTGEIDKQEEAWKRVAAAKKAATAVDAEAEKRIALVTDALQVQARTAGMNAVQQLVYAEALKAGALGNAEATVKIAGYVNAIESLKATREIVDGIKARTESERIEAATIGMTTVAAQNYKQEQEALARERIKGVKLGDDQIAGIRRLSAANLEAANTTAALKLAEQLRFDRLQLGRSQTEQLVAAQLKGAGVDANSAAGKQLATDIRINDVLGDIKSTGGDALKGFRDDLKAGKGEAEAFANALQKISTKLEDKLIDVALSAGIKGLSGLLSGGFSPSGGLYPTASAAAVKFHSGGIVGLGGTPINVPAHVFANARRYHSGGLIGADEVPIIAQKGERVLRRGESAGGANITVHINQDLGGANGDEAVARIALAMTQRGMQQVLSQVPGISVRAINEHAMRYQ